jgi:hypothetical protein
MFEVFYILYGVFFLAGGRNVAVEVYPKCLKMIFL